MCDLGKNWKEKQMNVIAKVLQVGYYMYGILKLGNEQTGYMFYWRLTLILHLTWLPMMSKNGYFINWWYYKNYQHLISFMICNSWCQSYSRWGIKCFDWCMSLSKTYVDKLNSSNVTLFVRTKHNASNKIRWLDPIQNTVALFCSDRWQKLKQ